MEDYASLHLRSHMRNLTDCMERYHKAFGVYQRLADQNYVMGRWVDTEFRDTVNGMNFGLNGTDPFRVLSIGPGDGEIENKILSTFREKFDPIVHIYTTVVEPADDMVKKYQERVAAETSQLQNMTYDWRIQTMDEFQKAEANDGATFHFICTVHSIYYAENPQTSLKDLYGRLEPGGLLLIVTECDNSGYGQFVRHFPFLSGEKYHYPTSAEIQAACIKESIPISDELFIKIRANITACFGDPKEMVEDGRQLLDLFTHMQDFTRDAPPKLLQEVREFLGSDLCSEKGDGGEVYLRLDSKALIVRRQ